jgi:hypothetical protein
VVRVLWPTLRENLAFASLDGTLAGVARKARVLADVGLVMEWRAEQPDPDDTRRAWPGRACRILESVMVADKGNQKTALTILFFNADPSAATIRVMPAVVLGRLSQDEAARLEAGAAGHLGLAPVRAERLLRPEDSRGPRLPGIGSPTRRRATGSARTVR